MSDQEEVGRLAQDAIGDLMQKLTPGAVVTRFVALVEVLDPDGERGNWLLATPESQIWDILGLIEHARAMEYAAVARREADDEEGR